MRQRWGRLSAVAAGAVAAGLLSAVPGMPAGATAPQYMGPLVRLDGGTAAYGDGGPAEQAVLDLPGDIDIQPDGRIVLVDWYSNSVRRLEPDGTISCLAGCSHLPGFGGDGGPATDALLDSPDSVAVTPDGAIYVSDYGNYRLRRIDPATGVITTVAGTGSAPTTWVAAGTATAVAIRPRALTAMADGSLRFADAGVREAVRALDGSALTTALGGAVSGGYDDPPVTATGVALAGASDLVQAPDGSLLVLDGHTVVRVAGGLVSRVAGQPYSGVSEDTGAGGPALDANFGSPRDIAVRADGVVLVATGPGVMKFTVGGTVSWLNEALSINAGMVHRDGFLWSRGTVVEQYGINGVQKTDSGNVTTVVAGQRPWALGDGGHVNKARFSGVSDVLALPDGSTFVAGGSFVRKVAPDGTVSTVAGTKPSEVFQGEGGPAEDAVLPSVVELAGTPDGDLYVGTLDGAVRRIDHSDGTIRTVLGTGTRWSDAPGTPPVGPLAGTSMPLAYIGDLSIGPDGSVWVLDSDNYLFASRNQRLVRLTDGQAEQLTDRSGSYAEGSAALGGTWADLPGLAEFAVAPDGSQVGQAWDGYLHTAGADGVIAGGRPGEQTDHLEFAADGDMVNGTTRYNVDGTADLLYSGTTGVFLFATERSATDDRLVVGYSNGLYQRSIPLAPTRPAPPTSAVFGTAVGAGKTFTVTSPMAAGLAVAAVQRPASAGGATRFADGFPLRSGPPPILSVDDPRTPLGSQIVVTAWTVDEAHGFTSTPASWSTRNEIPLACAVSPTSRTVAYGAAVSVVAKVTMGGTSLAKQGSAGTWAIAPGGLAQTTAAAAATSASGTTGRSVTVKRTTKVTYTAPASGQWGPCSRSVTYTVVPTLTTSLSRTSVARGGSFSVTAALASPKAASEPVSVQRKSGTSWVTVATGRTGSTGLKAFSLKASTKAGTYYYRVVKPATAAYGARTGPALKLVVR